MSQAGLLLIFCHLRLYYELQSQTPHKTDNQSMLYWQQTVKDKKNNNLLSQLSDRLFFFMHDNLA
jgi:hypothetical protein